MKKALLLTVAAMLVSGSAFAADSYHIRYQSVYPGPHVINVKILEPWVKEVTEKSGGRLDVEYFSSGAIIKLEDANKSVKTGTLDMASFSTPQAVSDFPHLATIGLAFLAKDSEHGTRIAWEMYKRFPEVKKELEQDVQFLTMWTSDRSGIFSTKTAVKSPADLKGKRVLFWSGGQGDQIKQWGGIPVQVPINDTYVALQRGMGEAFFGPLPAGTSQKLMEVAKHVTVLPINVGTISMVMNKDYFDDLPKDLQQFLLDNTGEAMGARTATALKNSTDADMETMTAQGSTIYHLTPEEVQAFAAPLAESDNTYWIDQMARYGEPNGAEWLPKVRAVAKETE